jgi:18S rRNA (adenine1779-N6/adenine1780-N6)-dimethyltransferase
MPKATSERFSRAHQPSSKKNAEASSSSGVTNPIFNTERFGQHILKNPGTAQKWASSSCHWDVLTGFSESWIA